VPWRLRTAANTATNTPARITRNRSSGQADDSPGADPSTMTFGDWASVADSCVGFGSLIGCSVGRGDGVGGLDTTLSSGIAWTTRPGRRLNRSVRCARLEPVVLVRGDPALIPRLREQQDLSGLTPPGQVVSAQEVTDYRDEHPDEDQPEDKASTASRHGTTSPPPFPSVRPKSDSLRHGIFAPKLRRRGLRVLHAVGMKHISAALGRCLPSAVIACRAGSGALDRTDDISPIGHIRGHRTN
jgi:hypothetical protein